MMSVKIGNQNKARAKAKHKGQVFCVCVAIVIVILVGYFESIENAVWRAHRRHAGLRTYR